MRKHIFLPFLVLFLSAMGVSSNLYNIKVTASTEAEFQSTPSIPVDSTVFLNEAQATKMGYLTTVSPKELVLKLVNGTLYSLNKEKSNTEVDEQFGGYTFVNYDTQLQCYMLWENWLEAGHPIIVNALNGETTVAMGTHLAASGNPNLFASYAEDIGSGWTPNGIQVLQKKEGIIVELFQFNPLTVLNENWGPVQLKWKDKSTILIHGIAYDTEGGYTSVYKKLRFAN